MDTNLYFGDAVHIIYGAELGYCWCFERQEVKSLMEEKDTMLWDVIMPKLMK